MKYVAFSYSLHQRASFSYTVKSLYVDIVYKNNFLVVMLSI